MTAYFADLRFDAPRVIEFKYEKKTARYYMKCEPVGVIVGGKYSGYLSRRVPLEEACDDLPGAMRRVIRMLKQSIEAKKVRLNDARSRLGEVEAVARGLGVEIDA